MPPDLYFWTVAVLAVFIVALSKSGLLGSLGMVAVPMMSLVMPARDAAGMLLPLLLVMDAIAVWTYRKDADWRILKIMLPGAMVGTLIGWALWSFVSDAMVLLFIGIITLLFILDALLPLRKKLEGLPPSRPWGAFWGGFAGFTSFISHTGGPPFQIYVLPQRLTPVIYSGTTAFFFAIVNTAKLVPYFFLGQLNVSNLTHAAILAPLAVVGVMVGVWLVRRISVKRFYQLTYWLVFLLSLKLIYDGAVGVFMPGAAA
ncbi:sulfite exporter TauE/SafE family protein [Devosia sp. A16]|uniref:sulfite exporter TauE/SafE family protein n=1 Tax=Devosia sp. A16 TaxID=1736675 RepID=UPI0006D8617E|nr:sulfite exporter TauE/SafE family protein [Devosia sp. A16]